MKHNNSSNNQFKMKRSIFRQNQQISVFHRKIEQKIIIFIYWKHPYSYFDINQLEYIYPVILKWKNDGIGWDAVQAFWQREHEIKTFQWLRNWSEISSWVDRPSNSRWMGSLNSQALGSLDSLCHLLNCRAFIMWTYLKWSASAQMNFSRGFPALKGAHSLLSQFVQHFSYVLV